MAAAGLRSINSTPKSSPARLAHTDAGNCSITRRKRSNFKAATWSLVNTFPRRSLGQAAAVKQSAADTQSSRNGCAGAATCAPKAWHGLPADAVSKTTANRHAGRENNLVRSAIQVRAAQYIRSAAQGEMSGPHTHCGSLKTIYAYVERT